MPALFRKNSKVYWKWLGKNIEGVVLATYFEPVTKELKGKKIKRNGSDQNPAYLVQSLAGNQALKLQSELQALEPKSSKVSSRKTPKMFS